MFVVLKIFWYGLANSLRCRHIVRYTDCLRQSTLQRCFWFNTSSIITSIGDKAVEWNTPKWTATNFIPHRHFCFTLASTLRFGIHIRFYKRSSLSFFFCNGSKRRHYEGDSNVFENLDSILKEGYPITNDLATSDRRHSPNSTHTQMSPGCSTWPKHSHGFYNNIICNEIVTIFSASTKEQTNTPISTATQVVLSDRLFFRPRLTTNQTILSRQLLYTNLVIRLTHVRLRLMLILFFGANISLPFVLCTPCIVILEVIVSHLCCHPHQHRCRFF